MLIDCDACAVRGPACGDCVVSVLLTGPATSGHHSGHHHPDQEVLDATHAPGAVPAGGSAELDAAERAAIAVLAGCGLVPPLRLVPVEPVRSSSPGEQAPPTGPGGRGGRRNPGTLRTPIAESEREVS